MAQFNCPGVCFDLARFHYLPNCTTLSISFSPKDDPENLDSTIQRLFACQKTLKTKFVTYLPFLEQVRDLTLCVVKRIEVTKKTTPVEKLLDGLQIGERPILLGFYQELVTLISQRERYLCHAMTLLLQESSASEVTEAKNKVEGLAQLLADANQSLCMQEPFKSARKQYQMELTKLMEICTHDTIARWVNAAIKADFEFSFMRHFLSQEHPPLKLAGFNSALKAIGVSTVKASDRARFRVNMYLEATKIFPGQGVEYCRRARRLSELENLQELLPNAQERGRAILQLLLEAASQTNQLEAESYLQILIRHLINLEDSFDWLACLIQDCRDNFVLCRIIDACVQNRAGDNFKSSQVFLRYLQLQSIPKSRSYLSKSEKFYLAYYIETEICHSSTFNSAHKRKPHILPTLALARSLIHTSEFGDIIILGKRKDPGLPLPRPTKRFSPVLYLPHDSKKPPLFGMQWVNIPSSTKSILAYRNEAAVHQSLNGKTGIWPILDVCHYSSKQVPETTPSPQLSVTQLMADGTLLHALNRDINLSARQIFAVLHQVCLGLDFMHNNKNLVHGHINLAHIFIKQEPDGSILAGLSGFSNACFLPNNIAKGSYGSQAYTAPELFGQKSNSSDLYKLDTFAIGCLLYQWLYGQDPPWMTLEQKNRLHELEKFEKQPQKVAPGPITLLHTLMHNALKINPDERISITQVCAVMLEVEALLKNPSAACTVPIAQGAPAYRFKEHLSL